MLENTNILDRLITYILDPLILLIFSLGLLLFLWGLVEFLRNGANPVKSNEGKDHMIWGVIGMFIMIAAYGILSIIIDTFGFNINSPSPSFNSNSGNQQQIQYPSPR